MEFHKGKHEYWREVSIRICKYHLDADEYQYYAEVNLWWWYASISWITGGKQ